MFHVTTLPPKGGVYPSLYPSPWPQNRRVWDRRARLFLQNRPSCTVVVPVACVPRHPMRMLINFGEFLNDFGSLFGRFFDLQTMLKLCLLTFYIAYTQSLISNTPYKVLKVFHLRASLEIQENSPLPHTGNR